MIMSRQSIIGSILKYLRNDRNYTQRKVSSFLHISEQTYSHYETGVRTPPYDILYQLSLFYEVDFSLFLASLQQKEHTEAVSKDSFILLDQCKQLTKADQNDLLFYTKMKAAKHIPST